MNKQQQFKEIFCSKKAFLAPMAGITDSVFREICKESGCALTYTEMISAKGLHFTPESKKTDELLRVSESENPFAIQIFGSDCDIMAEQAKLLCDKYYDKLLCIDINMGCPSPKITKNGEGSALMKTPQLASKVINAVVNAVCVPVTVKFRKGFFEKDNTAKEFAIMAEQAGASAVALHARTKMQYYSGKADWDAISQVKQAVSIPVVGNGDIFSAQDAIDMFAQTNCDSVMIARGVQGNPWIFNQILELQNNKEILEITPRQRIEIAMLHTKRFVEYKGERSIIEMRKHIAWYINSMRNSAHIRNLINTCTSLEIMTSILENYLVELEKQ